MAMATCGAVSGIHRGRVLCELAYGHDGPHARGQLTFDAILGYDAADPAAEAAEDRANLRALCESVGTLRALDSPQSRAGSQVWAAIESIALRIAGRELKEKG